MGVYGLPYTWESMDCLIHGSLWRLPYTWESMEVKTKKSSNTAKFDRIVKQIDVHLYGVGYYPCAKFERN